MKMANGTNSMNGTSRFPARGQVGGVGSRAVRARPELHGQAGASRGRRDDETARSARSRPRARGGGPGAVAASAACSTTPTGTTTSRRSCGLKREFGFDVVAAARYRDLDARRRAGRGRHRCARSRWSTHPAARKRSCSMRPWTVRRCSSEPGVEGQVSTPTTGSPIRDCSCARPRLAAYGMA